MVITKLDILDKFEKIKICTHYEYKGEVLSYFPSDENILSNIKPIYKEFEGWDESTFDVSSYEALNSKAKEFLKNLEDIVGIPIAYISTGPSREATIPIKKS